MAEASILLLYFWWGPSVWMAYGSHKLIEGESSEPEVEVDVMQ